MNIEKELLNLKERIDSSKTKYAQLEGRLSNYYERLKEEFECNTIGEAELKLKKLEIELENLTEDHENKIIVFKEKYQL